MGRWVSPNDIQKAAEEHMLAGQKPVTRDDWILCANFWAANIQKGLEEGAVPLMGLIFECPLTKDELLEVAKFQAVRK
jgi:uncharacterized protein (DUF2237 family)